MGSSTEKQSNVYSLRLDRARSAMESRRLDAYLVTNPKSIFYLTGFRGSAGVLLLAAKEGHLWVDPRYTLQAREEAIGVDVFEERRGILKAAGRSIKTWKARRSKGKVLVGIEQSNLAYSAFHALQHETKGKVSFAPAGELLEGLRAVKDSVEIEYVRQAARASSDAFVEVRSLIKPGVKEADLANELEYRMKQRGAEGPAFETIVAGGPRGAWPHARASSNTLETGQFVIFDFGAIVRGYASDMTRTVYIGRPSRSARSIYNAVLGAQQAALEALRGGIRGSEPDRAARRFLKQMRLDRFFTHSTGHGVGLDIHEDPRLAKGVKNRISVGNVVTVEPGVYMEGFGGVRIEDTVLVGEQGPELLTTAPKDDWIIGWE